MNIYIGNLPLEITGDDLSNTFSIFGEVVSVKIIKDEYNGKSKGFGFVEMPIRHEAETAIKTLHNTELKGKMIFVNQAKSNRPDHGKKRRKTRRRNF